jgi:Tfp pilus assembly protein PilX
MRKPFAEPFKKLKSNRGSGIITVLVAMMFIAILGSALLFTSYTGYRIKIAERGGKESFYDASAAMDEIKSGIQQAVTESLSTAYTDVLSEYTTLSAAGDAAIQAKFTEVFVDDLTLWETDAGNLLFSSASTYSADTLRTFLSTPPTGAVVTVSGGACTVTQETSGEDSLLRLEGISVTYTDADGYESSITSDIIISMPDFHATTSTVVSSELSSFALIADGTLYSDISDPSLAGNTYVGAVSLTANGNNFTLTSGTFVCAGNAGVGNGALFKTDSGTELWAGNVTIGTNGAAGLYGRTFVADDLTLDGNGSSAELKGSYYGFGNGSNAGASSAIVVNGKNTALDIDSLDRLVLAGVGFVNTPDGSVRTGESISAKSNQLAYLIDKSCLSVSAFFDNNGNGVFDAGDTEGTITGDNPCVFSGNYLTFSINTGAALWGGTKSLQYYGVNSTYDAETGAYSYSGITPVVKNLAGTGGYKMAYFFINFSSQDKANEYFRDYFSANPDKIEEYLGVYTDLSNKASVTTTSGNTLYEDASDNLTLLANAASVNVEGRATQFTNRCQTLNPGKPAVGYTPYTYYVDQSKISGTTTFTLPDDATGTVVGRVIEGDYTVNAYESAKVIIATGSVTVSADYSGLIIAGGNVTMNANVTYLPSEAEDVLYGSVDGAGNLLSSYLLNTVVGEDDGSSFISSWDLDLLVAYDNWSKN